MVNVTIDGYPVSVPDGTTIMEAAREIGIPIPRLCYLEKINEIAACRVCVVEIEGKDHLVTSCNNAVEEGMIIYTNSPKVRKNRRTTIELIMSQHDCHCATCPKNGNCSLQKIVNDLNITEIPFRSNIERTPWNQDFPLIRDSSKCIKCMRCIQICDKVQKMHIWDLTGTGSQTTIGVSGSRSIEEADCALCGQCITHCPTAALRERDDTERVWEAIENKNTVTVVQIAPAVRAAWGEALGLNRNRASIGKIVDALKRIGFDYVFDTTFSADLTIMEESREFVERFRKGETRERPMFTSCCPGWVRFLKSQYPHMISRLSTAKSPQQMFGAVMKSYFAENMGIRPENIVTVSIMPCVAKKGEAKMDLFHEEYAGHDVDFVLTTRELTRMIRAAHIQPDTLKDRDFDSLMREGTGAGVIFGTTGGVMEAAMRTAHYLITGKNPSPDAFRCVRSSIGQKDWKEAVIHIGEAEIRAAVVNGLGNTRKLLEEIEAGRVHFDFVEVMACPGGCAGGGGQPVCDGEELSDSRRNHLYHLDEQSEKRFSHENKDVLKLYNDYLEVPGSHKAHMLLHTDHAAWEMPRSPGLSD